MSDTKSVRTMEEAAKLLKTIVGYPEGGWIRFFADGSGSVRESHADHPQGRGVCTFDRIDQLFAWLDSKQPPKTVMVELNREDAAAMKNNLFPSGLNPFGSRICKALDKALGN